MQSLSLRDVINQSLALGEHHVKTAQEEGTYPSEEKKKKKEKEKRDEYEKESHYTPTQEILKLAEACDYITHKVAAEGRAPSPGVGPGALPLELVTKGDGRVRMGGASTKRMPQRAGEESPSAPGVTARKSTIKTDYAEQPGAGSSMNVKSSAARLLRVRNIIKTAKEQDLNGPASSAIPTNMGGPSQEGIPSNARVLQSSQKVIDVKKRQLKEEPKKDLKKVLDEPAQSKKTDPVLHDALNHVDEAGAKISSPVATEAARLLLKKMASQGCTCGDRHVCGFCKLSEAMEEKKKKDKEDEEESESEPPSASASIQH